MFAQHTLPQNKRLSRHGLTPEIRTTSILAPSLLARTNKSRGVCKRYAKGNFKLKDSDLATNVCPKLTSPAHPRIQNTDDWWYRIVLIKSGYQGWGVERGRRIPHPRDCWIFIRFCFLLRRVFARFYDSQGRFFQMQLHARFANEFRWTQLKPDEQFAVVGGFNLRSVRSEGVEKVKSCV